MGASLVDDAAGFLAKTPPFLALTPNELQLLAGSVRAESYAKHTSILTQGGPPSAHLLVVARGSARVFMTTEDGGDIEIDRRGPGDTIGFLSLYSGDRSRTHVVALEDTTCYLIPREPFLALFNANPFVREFFHRAYCGKYLDRAFGDLRAADRLSGIGERLLFSTTVGQILVRAPVTAPREVTIRTAAELMSLQRVSSLVLTAEDGSPVGIVTDRDLRDKVTAKGRDVAEPVANVMTPALYRIDAAAYCFEALLQMIQQNIHHLLVVDQGRLRGVVTNHDLMVLQGTSPASVAREIESQHSVEDLAKVAGKVNGVAGWLLKEGAKAEHITHVITEVNDRLVRKAAELALRQLPPAPLPWCWIVFGSEGRREQTYKTDQDNAIVHADPAGPAEEAAAREWFPRFAAIMKETLVRVGFAPCPADYMAANPRWTQPLETWKGYFTRWILNPGGEALLRAVIFFDFRPLVGAAGLAEELRAHLQRVSRNQNIFFARLAGTVVRHRPPLGVFGSLAVEKEGEHAGEINLKISALGPIVDIARLCALEAGIPETPTLERLRALRGKHPLVTQNGEELEHAYEFLSHLRIRRQYEQLRSGRPLSNFVDPEELSLLERRQLKEAFRLVARVQDLIVEEYRAGLVGG